MRIEEIEMQIADQNSARRAFPSQGPTLDQMFDGDNQRALLELQIRSAKALAEQQNSMTKTNDNLSYLLMWTERLQIAAAEREKVEDQRFKENTRYSRIAAWAGVISTILAALAIFK